MSPRHEHIHTELQVIREKSLSLARENGSVLQETEIQHVTKDISSADRGQCQGWEARNAWIASLEEVTSTVGDKQSWNGESR